MIGLLRKVLEIPANQNDNQNIGRKYYRPIISIIRFYECSFHAECQCLYTRVSHHIVYKINRLINYIIVELRHGRFDCAHACECAVRALFNQYTHNQMIPFWL